MNSIIKTAAAVLGELNRPNENSDTNEEGKPQTRATLV